MKIRKADRVPAEPVTTEGAHGVHIRLLIARSEAAPNFYMRQFDVAPGGHTPRHSHHWEHEMYVLAGEGTAETPDGPRPVAAGDCVYVPPGEEHQFRNTGHRVLKLLCLVPKTE